MAPNPNPKPDPNPDPALFIPGARDKLHVIDLGMAKSYRDDKTGAHKVMEKGKGLNGTARYASINAHEGRTQSRRDDMESLGYMMVYLSQGSLPWQGLQPSDDKNGDILKVKISKPIEDFCSHFPAAEALCEHLNYARSLEYEARPDYEYLKSLYVELLEKYDVENDGVWDWNESGEVGIMAGEASQWRPGIIGKGKEETDGKFPFVDLHHQCR